MFEIYSWLNYVRGLFPFPNFNKYDTKNCFILRTTISDLTLYGDKRKRFESFPIWIKSEMRVWFMARALVIGCKNFFLGIIFFYFCIKLLKMQSLLVTKVTLSNILVPKIPNDCNSWLSLDISSISNHIAGMDFYLSSWNFKFIMCHLYAVWYFYLYLKSMVFNHVFIANIYLVGQGLVFLAKCMYLMPM